MSWFTPATIASGSEVTAVCAPNQSHQMRRPHSGRQTFAADVTQREDDAVVRFFHGEEITGQVAHGENLAGDFEVSVTNQTRRAQTTVHLRRFENRGVQFSVILLQRGELNLQLLPARLAGTLWSRRVRARRVPAWCLSFLGRVTDS